MLLRTLWTGGSVGSIDHLQPEQGGDITIIKHLGCGRYCFFQRKFLSGICKQLVLVDTAQREKQCGLFVEPGADAIEYRRDVFTHAGPVGAAARQLDLLGRGKEPITLPTDPVHDAF